ncbi:PPA1309 family protein [Propionicicella superfundia]|uniref:PPA1309 family protein n=1 Tax=Propionicicella superfundia TaxID=348582 RepID=UPI00048F7EC1|nr:PPA1309 family protein [Propionicicella superfundia]
MAEEALFRVLRDVEAHVGRSGWDQPARLFALVGTALLAASEPAVAEAVAGTPDEDALSAVEQDGFRLGDDIVETFARIAWGPAVAGCALAVERTMVPREVEDDLPADPSAAARVVATHPRRMDLRLVVGVLRDGSHHAVARLANRPEELLSGADMVPGLVGVLAQTLTEQGE